ncbi:MAG: cytochrome c, partial [Terracidiphilus sp.]
MCHGAKLQGNPPQVPSLVDIGKRMTDDQIVDMIHKGKAPMPPFPDIKGDELSALLKFLTGKEPTTTPAAAASPEAGDDAE